VICDTQVCHRSSRVGVGCFGHYNAFKNEFFRLIINLVYAIIENLENAINRMKIIHFFHHKGITTVNGLLCEFLVLVASWWLP
jgi:hypothetical protein